MNGHNQTVGASAQDLGPVCFPYTILHTGAQTVSVDLDSTKKFIFLFTEKKCKRKFKNMF